MLAGEDVLGGLVFHETTAGLVDSHLGENEVLVQSGDGGLGDDTINLLLVEVLEFVESFLARATSASTSASAAAASLLGSAW